jgi:hypothetical protein
MPEKVRVSRCPPLSYPQPTRSARWRGLGQAALLLVFEEEPLLDEVEEDDVELDDDEPESEDVEDEPDDDVEEDGESDLAETVLLPELRLSLR